ncbi:MAG: hypothetical protein LUE29_09605 [Lachnospiraceae bacterium]|nr:hypothetical protein [Lachnospiraceae bacterium]
MSVTLSQEDCYCDLQTFYKNVATKMGVTVTGSTLFDCRKISVTKQVQDELWAYYYQEEGYSNMQISALFLAMGPKANIDQCKEEYLAKTEDGFVA